MALDSTYEFSNEWCHADTPSTNAPLPPATQAIAGSGRTSIAKGFPEETAKPIDESGIPPYRLDFNGILRQITANLVWYAKGGMFDWSSLKTYSYPAIVRYATNGYYYTCVAASVPAGTLPTNTTYWKRILNNDDIMELQSLYLPLSGGTLTGALAGTTSTFSYITCAGTAATNYIGFIGKSSTSAQADKTVGTLTLKDTNGNVQGFNGSAGVNLSNGIYYAANAGKVGYKIQFKNSANTTVAYDGSATLDLTSGVYYAVTTGTASKVANKLKLKNTSGTVVQFDGSSLIDLTSGVNYATSSASADHVGHSISFKNASNTSVSFNGAGNVDLTGGVYYATTANHVNNSISFKNTSNQTVSFNGSSAVDLTGGVWYANRATNDANGTNIANTYLKKTGDTMSGALTLANGTWNSAGDDAYFGDGNVAGCFCVKGKNGTTGIGFTRYGGTATDTLTNDSGNLKWNGGSIALLAYPVGSIYMSVNSTSPATLFGGTWQRIGEGKCLIDCGSTYTAGSTGGSATKTLSTSEMPSHNHSASTGSAGAHTHTRGTMDITGTFPAVVEDQYLPTPEGAFYYNGQTYDAKSLGSEGNWRLSFAASRSWSGATSEDGSHTHSVSVGNSGSGASFSIMQPYLAVYMWKRTQ